MKKFIYFLLGAFLTVPLLVKSATVLFPYQGGTGISTSSSSTVGYFLQISTTSPYLGYTFAPAASSFTTPTLQQVTDAGATTLNKIQFAGGTSTAAFTVQGLLTAPTGSFTYIDATTTNATFATVGTLTASNATITNVSSTNMSVSSSLLVTGKAVCLADGTNCLPTTTPTLQQVATAGNTTSLALIFAGGTSTANFVVTGTLSAQTTTLGQTAITNGLSVVGNATISGNATSSNFFATGLSGTNLTYTSATGTNHTITNLTSSNVTISGGTINGTSIGATTPSTGVFTNATSTNLAVTGSITGASLSLSGALVVSGVTTLATTTVTNFTASNTSTLATTTATTLSVSGATTLTGAATAGSTLAVTGAATFSSTLSVSGATTLATTTVTNFTASRTSTLATTTITSLSVNGVGYPSAAGSAGQIFRSNGTNFALSTSIWPDTTTINQILYSSAANTIAGITTANNGVLVTTGSGVPVVSSTLPTAVQGNITSVGTLTGLTVSGLTSLASTTITGNATTTVNQVVGGTLSVTGASTLTGNVTAAGTLTVTSSVTNTLKLATNGFSKLGDSAPNIKTAYFTGTTPDGSSGGGATSVTLTGINASKIISITVMFDFTGTGFWMMAGYGTSPGYKMDWYTDNDTSNATLYLNTANLPDSINVGAHEARIYVTYIE